MHNMTRRLAIIAALGALGATSTTRAATLNFDLNRAGDALYSGTALAPDPGTTWNEIVAGAAMTVSGALDSTGAPTSVGMTVTPFDGDATPRAWSNGSNGSPNPADLMSEYLYPGNGTQYSVTVSGLAAGSYSLYVYAHGDQPNQTSLITVDAANGGASASTGETGADWRDIYSADGPPAVTLPATVDGSGALTFTTSYLNGFQVMPVPEPGVTLLAGFGLLGLARRRRR